MWVLKSVKVELVDFIGMYNMAQTGAKGNQNE